MKNLKPERNDALQFISAKDIALAGASRNPKKFGNIVYRTLKSKGWNVFPINPQAEHIDNELCYRSVNDLPSTVKNLVVLVKPSESENVVREAIGRGISKVWLQQGSESEQAIRVAKEAGITLITGKCVLMYANPSGFHKFHMFMSKLFGKY